MRCLELQLKSILKKKKRKRKKESSGQNTAELKKQRHQKNRIESQVKTVLSFQGSLLQEGSDCLVDFLQTAAINC